MHLGIVYFWFCQMSVLLNKKEKKKETEGLNTLLYCTALRPFI